MRPSTSIKAHLALALLFALLVALCAYGQVPYHNSVVWRAQQWKAPAGETYDLWYPTNIPGYTAYAYWVASFYTTNAGIATLPTLIGSSLLDLTIAESSTYSPSLVGGALRFTRGTTNNNRGTTLQAVSNGLVGYILPQPSEVVMLVNDTDSSTTGANQYFFDGGDYTGDASHRQAAYTYYTTNNSAYAGTDLVIASRITNKWYMLGVAFNGASTVFYTNGVTMATGNAGTQTAYGFHLCSIMTWSGSPLPYGSFVKSCDIYEAVSYATNLTPAIRSNMWRNWKYKYSLTP